MPEGGPHPLRVVRALVQAAVASGGRHNLTQVAAAIAYALLVTLAPVVLAYALLRRTIEQLLSLPPSDILGASASLTGVDLSAGGAGVPAWLSGGGPWLVAVFTLFGATAAFGLYVNAIAVIWDQPAERGAVRIWLRRRLLGLLLLVGSALLLAVASVAGSLVSALAGYIDRLADRVGLDALPIEFFLNARFVFGFLGLFLLFSVSVFVIPKNRPKFRDVWPGIVATSVAYVLGDAVLGAYLSSSSRFEALGAFGALIGSLLWVYYSVIIVLYGAELTRELDRMKRARRRPFLTPEDANVGTG